MVDVHTDDLVHDVSGDGLHDDGAHLARVERVLLQVAEHDHVLDRGLKRLRNELLESLLLKDVRQRIRAVIVVIPEQHVLELRQERRNLDIRLGAIIVGEPLDLLQPVVAQLREGLDAVIVADEADDAGGLSVHDPVLEVRQEVRRLLGAVTGVSRDFSDAIKAAASSGECILAHRTTRSVQGLQRPMSVSLLR